MTITGEPRHFCPVCGARVFAHERDATEIEVEVSSLDSTSLLPPITKGYVGRREAWLPDFGLPRYPGNPLNSL